jgi:hypothetical protein
VFTGERSDEILAGYVLEIESDVDFLDFDFSELLKAPGGR